MLRMNLLLLVATVSVPPVSAQDLVLTNARIVDPRAQTVADGSVWIVNGRVVDIGPDVPHEAPGDRIDLEGRWLVPAFVDLHTHSFGNAAPGGVFDGSGTEEVAEHVLRAGVVAFLDLFAAEDYILPLRDRQRAGDVAGASIFAAGPCFTAPGGHCTEYGIPTRVISSPEEARDELLELVPKRPDAVKVVYDHFDYGATTMPSIDGRTLAALISAAAESGLKTVVHVGTWEDVRHAVLAGATAVTHVPRDGVVPEDVAALMASSGTYHIPTLTVHSDLAEFFDNPSLLEAPLFQALAADTIRSTYGQGVEALDDPSREWIDGVRARRPAAIESVRRLHAAGVHMLVGTDAGNWGTIQGFSVHREMVRLVEAGLSSWEALAAATTSAGDFLGRRFGVRPGDEASFVALDGSPLEDTGNTQRVVMVVQTGRVVHQR